MFYLLIMPNLPNETKSHSNLISAFQKGEVKALSHVIRRFERELVFFAIGIIKVRELAEEIVEDSFLKVWNRKESFQHENQIKSFLYTTVKNACLDFIKSPKNKSFEDISSITELIPSEDNLEANLIYSELLGLLYAEVNKLPEKQRKVFYMSYIEGLSTDEISNELGISYNAVFLNKFEATKTLKKIFGEVIFGFILCYLITG